MQASPDANTASAPGIDGIVARRHVIVAVLTNAVVFAFGPIQVAIVTRSLTMAEFGIFSLAKVSVVFVTYCLTLGLDQYLARMLPGKPHDEQQRLFSSVVILLMGLGMVVTVVGAVGVGFIPQLRGYAVPARIGLVIAITTVYFLLLAQRFYGNRQLVFYNVLILLRNTVWIVLMFAASLIIPLDLDVVLACWLAGMILTISVGVSVLGLKDAVPTQLDTRVMREGISFSIPLFPLLLGFWFIMLNTRYFIAAHMGVDKVALFSVAFVLVEVLAATINNIPDTIFPHVVALSERLTGMGGTHRATAYDARTALRGGVVKGAVLFLVPCSAVLFAAKTPLIRVLAGEEYVAAAKYVVWLLPVPFIRVFSRVWEQELMIQNRTVVIGVSYLASMVLNVAANAIMVPRLGMGGACASVVISLCFLAFALGWQVRDHGRTHAGAGVCVEPPVEP